jgi:hypothetical protein
MYTSKETKKFDREIRRYGPMHVCIFVLRHVMPLLYIPHSSNFMPGANRHLPVNKSLSAVRLADFTAWHRLQMDRNS